LSYSTTTVSTQYDFSAKEHWCSSASHDGLISGSFIIFRKQP
jgi:hypothetical protein